jgi:hypothetical protein
MLSVTMGCSISRGRCVLWASHILWYDYWCRILRRCSHNSGYTFWHVNIVNNFNQSRSKSICHNQYVCNMLATWLLYVICKWTITTFAKSKKINISKYNNFISLISIHWLNNKPPVYTHLINGCLIKRLISHAKWCECTLRITLIGLYKQSEKHYIDPCISQINK